MKGIIISNQTGW